MTQEQYAKATRITERMAQLEKEFDKWQKCNCIYNMRLGVVDTNDFECVDTTFIDFGNLKDEIMSAIKAEVAQLEAEFENL